MIGLQQNLTSLGSPGMDFNFNKSKIILFNNNAPASKYTLNITALEQVTDSKYLGVTIQPYLKFNKHIVYDIIEVIITTLRDVLE